MFPFDKKDKLRRPSMFGDFDSLFAGFEDFDRYAEEMQTAMQAGQGQSFVYGYRAYTGEDGKPVVEEFSNIPGFKGNPGGVIGNALGGACQLPAASAAPVAEAGEEGAIEPYYDVLLDGDKIKAIVELPGVEEGTIKVEIQGRTISVDAGTGDRTYSAKIKAPAYLEPKPEATRYKNGVLELTISKAKRQKDPAVE